MSSFFFRGDKKSKQLISDAKEQEELKNRSATEYSK